jgi:hypothetical protein
MDDTNQHPNHIPGDVVEMTQASKDVYLDRRFDCVVKE